MIKYTIREGGGRVGGGGGRIPISFTEEEGRPLCAYASKFVSEIDVAVRLFAPIQFESRGVIPNDKKELLFQRLLVSKLISLKVKG